MSCIVQVPGAPAEALGDDDLVVEFANPMPQISVNQMYSWKLIQFLLEQLGQDG